MQNLLELKTKPAVTAAAAKPRGDLCFMETQFPVSKMSKESYAERTAKQSQTLTGLGKWWGRKPLVLCRATILGLLMPASDDPKRDREIFLKLMTMDEEGLRKRKSQPITLADGYALLPQEVRNRVFEWDAEAHRPNWV